MLLGENAGQMQNLPSTLVEYQALADAMPTANSPKGRIGEVYPNFATVNQKEERYRPYTWYEKVIYAPSNSADILKAGYGANCLTHSIDIFHNNPESGAK